MSYESNQGARTKRHRAEEGSSISKLFQNAAVGVGVALLCSILMLLIGAMICQRSEDPQAIILPWGLGALYLSALIGGTVSVRRNGGAALLCGALCGAILMIFFWFLSIFFQGNNAFSLPISLLLRTMTALFSIFGALIFRKRPSRRLHRKR